MKKCYGCNWYTDKCKNTNSYNYNWYAESITKCIPMLIDKNKSNEIIVNKRKDDSV
jgi:hypothetical protein